MTPDTFRPQIGETLFVSLHNNQPFLITVLDYHSDPRFSGEQFKFARKNGRSDSASLGNAKFYPEVAIDTAFLYVVWLEEHEFMGKSEDIELGFFFDPQSAFDYIDAIKSGDAKPRFKASAEFVNYSVRVEKV